VPAFFFMQGCAGPRLHTFPAAEQEAALVLDAFERFQTLGRQACGCCLDAEADIALSVAGWFKNHTAKFFGYLQAMEPGSIRFVATNQLGQPLFLFASDGFMFRYLNVYQEKAYIGSTASEAYRKFVPPGFAPDFFFSWLTGRLPPVEIRVGEVKRGRDQDAFWLRLVPAGGSTESMILFDPEKLLIRRHVVMDDQGRELLDIRYPEYRLLPASGTPATAVGLPAASGPAPEQEGCRLPVRVTVTSSRDDKKIDISLGSFLAGTHFTAVDFQVDIPDNFQQLFVK
jgi:hypothetical protein